MIKKVVSILFLSLFLASLFAEDIDWQKEYIELMAEHEDTVEQLESVGEEYSDLLKSYDTLSSDYQDLFDLYTKKQVVINKSEEQLTADQELSKQQEDTINTLLKLVDPKYFTVFLQAGMIGPHGTVDLGLVADIPRIPISVIASGNYTMDVGFGAKIGLGVQF